MTIAVRLENVSKGYAFFPRPIDRLRALFGGVSQQTWYWALRDVSLMVAAGETFGIIGENGAGKSTLLKLVAGTIRPSSGRIQVSGRVAALLELGAGFHPEESGWENIRLMGALAGIPTTEMPRYVEEVAAFSELPADVLARPVKTYSSGMFMRLAFSAATNVDPDILVIDEALSVGDIHFQKKSLDRILAFRDQGKTVLFCSHNLYQVRSLCSRVAWLDAGRLRLVGETEKVVSAFENYEREKNAGLREAIPGTPFCNLDRIADAPVRLRAVAFADAEGKPVAEVETFQPCRAVVEIESAAFTPCHLGVAIVRNDRENVFGTATHFYPGARPLCPNGILRLALIFPSLPLLSGEYFLSVYVLDDSGLQVYDMAELICPFTVRGKGREVGIVYLDHRWEVT
ncbi:ABC transporter ATP-binding protein [Methylothermus subterraneus]